MKRIFAILLTVLFLQISANATIINAGTPVVVQLQKEVNADDYRLGDSIKFIVVQSVKTDNKVIIKAGTELMAKIIKKKNNFIFGIPGQIEIGEGQILTKNNELIKLRGIVSNKGDSRYWANIGWVCVFPLIFIKGDDGIISKDITHTLYTIDDYDIAD